MERSKALIDEPDKVAVSHTIYYNAPHSREFDNYDMITGLATRKEDINRYGKESK